MKTFNIQQNIGTVKYVVNYHNGVSKHKDGSDFFDIATFNNKKKLSAFVAKLKRFGYKPSNITNAKELKEFDVINMKDGRRGVVVLVHCAGTYEVEFPEGVDTFDVDYELDKILSIDIK